jgi:hypothetical protein
VQVYTDQFNMVLYHAKSSRLAELRCIQFTSTVQDYTDHFNMVLYHAKNLDNS